MFSKEKKLAIILLILFRKSNRFAPPSAGASGPVIQVIRDRAGILDLHPSRVLKNMTPKGVELLPRDGVLNEAFLLHNLTPVLILKPRIPLMEIPSYAFVPYGAACPEAKMLLIQSMWYLSTSRECCRESHGLGCFGNIGGSGSAVVPEGSMYG